MHTPRRALWWIINPLWRSPQCDGLRRAVGIYNALIGLGYAVIVTTGSRLTTSYQIQAATAPLWVFAALFISLGLAVAYTGPWRYTHAGRAVAAALFLLLAFVCGTWYQAGAWTGFLGYLGLMWLCFLEVKAVRRIDP